MEFDYFLDRMGDVYLTFGKKVADDKVLEIIFRRIEKLPNDFMDFVVRHFQDREDMPRNLGRYLLRDLWPDYLEKNPNLKSNQDYVCCPLCNEDTPGWRRIWTQDWEIKLVRCECGHAKNPDNEKIYTSSELESMGYILTRPYAYDVEKIKRRDNPNIGVNEPLRERHREILEDYSNIPF